MDRDLFRDVYTQFGFSTKEHTNDQTGSLGLGSKSPLAYTDTFKVYSVANGYRTSAIITRRADWSIFLDVVGWKATKDPNGTKVVIEVEPGHVEEFRQKAMDLFKFWLPGRVRISGDGGESFFEPEHHVGNKIADNLYEAVEWNLSWVVMGNVPYRIINSHALFSESKIDAMNFVAYVPMSEEEGIDFTPSREDLEYTPRTKATLRKVIKDFEEQMIATAEGELAACKTHAEAYVVWNKWTDLLGGRIFSDLTFKGDKFENTFEINGMRYERDRRRNGTWRIEKWRVDQMSNAVIVTGCPFILNGSLNNGHKTKARLWVDEVAPFSADYFIFIAADKVKSPWVDKTRIVKWEKIKAEAPKKERDPNSWTWNSGRIPGSWDYYTNSSYLSEKELPTKGKVFYVSCKDADNHNISSLMKITGLDADAAVIRMPGNRKAKFLRENPDVEEFIAWGRAKVNMRPVDLLSDDAKTVMSMDYDEQAMYEKLDADKIKDPDFKKYRNLLKNAKVLQKEYDDALALAREFGMYYTVKKHDPDRDSAPMMRRYPMLDRISWRYGRIDYKEDIYLYMNAKYAKLKKEGKV
jgi:hypothetical protein